MRDKRPDTARYEILRGDTGNRYRFFCALSGSAVCTTAPVKADSEEEEAVLAWESEGRKNFNRCPKCGEWTIAAMFNPDMLTCVRCSPLEYYPNFCPHCGARPDPEATFCHVCGSRLLYGGYTHAVEEK